MGKNTFGKTMPRALSQNLKIMGEQIMLARKRRHLSYSLHLIWKRISPCWLLTMLLADNFRMQNY